MNALICRSEKVISQRGNWYLNSTEQSTEADDRIDPTRVSKKYNNSSDISVESTHSVMEIV